MLETDRWVNDNGDNTHRLNYNLNSESIVLDIGGYKGGWSEKIVERFNPTIFIFEPVHKFFIDIQDKFINNSKVRCFNYALEGENRIDEINLLNDSTSLYLEGKKELIEVKDIVEVIYSYKLTHIDLMKINIEGSEYPLLNKILESGLVNNIDNLQIQFHEFADTDGSKRLAIQKELRKTHNITYNYNFVWENWQRR